VWEQRPQIEYVVPAAPVGAYLRATGGDDPARMCNAEDRCRCTAHALPGGTRR
jgi:hypothetical protein